MATLLSNELKAVVVPDNFLDNPINVLKENCLIVQHFDYECEHKRNDSGEVYGATKPVILEFSIRVNSPRHARMFYRRLISNEHSCFSFLFNITYGANERMSGYDDGMVVDGYVVHVEETYTTKVDDNGDKQMMLNVTLQVRSVIYLGRENNFKSTFIE
jgi:hypothetical protein